MKKLLTILFLTFFCFGCINKKSPEIENLIEYDILSDNIENLTEDDILSDNNIIYVIPYDGLNLRSEPSITGERIKLLPQNTKLTVLERKEEQEIIDDIMDCWYLVDTGNETGWVFGGYIFHKPIPFKIKNMEVAKIIAKNAHFIDDWVLSIEGAIQYVNNDTITVYTNNTKESESFIIEQSIVFLFKISDIPDWLYLISRDYENQGYIYLYDISKNSFYGDLKENEKSGNYYKSLQNKEYTLISQHDNINRYGPLLTINHNNNRHEFWDTRYGFGFAGYKYLLLDYYSEYDEILIREQYWEGSYNFIYNLEFKEYRCEQIEIPYFNNARTYLCSLVYLDDIGDTLQYLLKLFKVDNGFYQEIYNMDIRINRNSKENILWINDNEAHIDFNEAGKLIIEIGEEIKVTDNLIFPARVVSTY